jgi:hypothetical protein
VGETGQNNGLESYTNANDAIKSFEKKFKDKTRNDWKNRDNFKPSPGKYTLIEMDSSAATGEDEDEEEEESTAVAIVLYYLVLLDFLFEIEKIRAILNTHSFKCPL